MPDIVTDPGLVARCGLYCGACTSYLKGRCPGCHQNTKATWCKVRACCNEHGWATCAACSEHPDPKTCPKFHNVVSRIIGFVLRSDRSACIERIRVLGVGDYAAEMAARGARTLPRT